MSLIKNTSVYTLGALLPKMGAFVFLPIYLSYLSSSDYGIISSLHVLNGVLVVLFTLSMPRALYRIYYDYESQEKKKILFGTIFISVLVLALLSLCILFLMKQQVQKVYMSIDFYPYFAYALIIVFIQSLQVIPTIFLQIKERAAVFVSLSIALFFFKSILILWFIIGLKRGAMGYLEAELIAALVFLPIYYSFTYKEISLKWDRMVFKNVIHFSLPIVPGILSAWVLNLSDRVFIERYFSTADVGVYSLGYQIAGLVLIFSMAFKKAYDPYFYKMANTVDVFKAKKRLYSTNYVFVLVLLLVSFIISFFAKEGITLFFNNDYYSAIRIVPIISLAYLVSQNSALLNVMMYQEKKTKIVMYIIVGSALLNIFLNFILIPRIGIMGAAYATLISFLSVFLFSYLLAKKTFFIPYNWKGLAPIFILLLFVYFGFYFLRIENIYLSLVSKMVVVSVLALSFIIRYKTIIFSFIKTKR